MKKNHVDNHALIFITAVCVSCLIAACFSPWQGEGTFSITIGGGGRAAEVLSWDPSTRIADLDHTVILTNGTGEKDRRERIKAGQTVKFAVEPGDWDVLVFAYKGDALKAVGYKVVKVKPGQNNAESVTMGGVSFTGNSIAEFKAWLDTKPYNTPETAYSVKLNVSDMEGGVNEPGSLGNAMRTNYGKYVNLDLSGSTFNAVVAQGFNNTGLVSVTLPNGVTIISVGGFYFCENLKSINIPDRVTSIGQQAFYYCTSLTSVTIPASVTILSAAAFRYCPNLTSVTFEGPINPDYFAGDSLYPVFDGDLRDKYFSSNNSVGTPGTYTRQPGGEVWTKLP